ncbi:hypothetical protein ABW19_dt0201558 [Dactylella cylindrospora]|nr:hypothetical protein ABW19_dt0201558 [Dactylella cylindrospora]
MLPDTHNTVVPTEDREAIPRSSIDKKGKRRMSVENNQSFADPNTTSNNTIIKTTKDYDDSRRMAIKRRGSHEEKMLVESTAERRGPSAFSRLPKEIMQQ